MTDTISVCQRRFGSPPRRCWWWSDRRDYLKRLFKVSACIALRRSGPPGSVRRAGAGAASTAQTLVNVAQAQHARLTLALETPATRPISSAVPVFRAFFTRNFGTLVLRLLKLSPFTNPFN